MVNVHRIPEKADYALARGRFRHLPHVVPLGGETQEFPFDPTWTSDRRRRDRQGCFRNGLSWLVARNGRAFDRRATPDVQGSGPCLAVEAQAANPRYLREQREPTRLWSISRCL